MAWNQQGGRGSGGNKGGPWGQRPGGGPQRPGGGGSNGSGGGGQEPPDLEDLLRRGGDQFKDLFPKFGGFGIGGIAVVAFVLWLATGIYQVEQKEQGVVLRFGEFVYTTEPGLRWHLPYPIETVITPEVQTQQTMRIGGTQAQSMMLTGDENIVDLDFEIQWRISNAEAYLFNVAEPEQILQVTAESVMREIVGKNTMKYVLQQGRDEIESETRRGIQELMDEYEAGVLVESVQFNRADPHRDAIEAYNEVQAAEADRERMKNEAEAYANSVVPEAEGRAARVLQEAEAFKQRVIAEAEGEAQRFLSVYGEYKAAPDVTRQRIFIETMEEVLGGKEKVLIDKDGQGVVPFLPLNELSKKKNQ